MTLTKQFANNWHTNKMVYSLQPSVIQSLIGHSFMHAIDSSFFHINTRIWRSDVCDSFYHNIRMKQEFRVSQYNRAEAETTLWSRLHLQQRVKQFKRDIIGQRWKMKMWRNTPMWNFYVQVKVFFTIIIIKLCLSGGCQRADASWCWKFHSLRSDKSIFSGGKKNL